MCYCKTMVDVYNLLLSSGKLLVNSNYAHVLFDSGSTHSYVLPFFAKNFVEELVRLDCPFWVATPTGDTLLVEKGYRSCKVTVGKADTVADLMLHDMTNFDIILGMN